MSDWLYGQKCIEHCLICSQPGQVDAIAMWFDLHLDDVTTLSSAPDDDNDRDGVHRATCWDQAIFPLQSPICVTSGQKLNINIMCQGGKISINVCDQHRIGDTHTVNKLQNAVSYRKIPTVQNDSQPSEEFHDGDQSNPENFSSTAFSDNEYSKNVPVNISTYWKRKALCLRHTTQREVSSSSSVGENLLCGHDYEEEKTDVSKDMQDECEMTQSDTVLKSASFCNKMSLKMPESDVSCSTSRRLDCSAVVSQEVVQFLNDEQWMEALKKTAIFLRQQVRSFVNCISN